MKLAPESPNSVRGAFSGPPSATSIGIYPNPFNSQTTIAFTLPVRGQVQLDLFDILGRKVKNLMDERIEAGPHQVRFDASDLASGIYIYRMKAGDFSQSRKMVMLK